MGGRIKGTLCLVASAFGFAAMGMFIRLADDLGGPVSCFQKGFFRNVIAAVIAAALFARNRPLRALGASSSIPLLVLRSVLGTAGIFLNFYAISHMPLADAMMLNKLAPFFTVAFSWMFLGERLHVGQALCLCGALVGAACVVKPGFASATIFPAVCGLAGGIGAGGAYACVHALGRRRVDPSFIVLFFSVFSCIASVPFMVVDFAPMTPSQLASLVGAGAMAALGQFGVTAAYRHAEPRTIAAWDYTNILFAALFGLLLFGQVPDVWSVLGFVVIVLSAVVLLNCSGGKSSRKSKEERLME